MRAEHAEQRTKQRSAAPQANAPVEEAHRPIEEEELSQLDDIVDDNDVYHGNDEDEEECVGSETMDVDDDEEEQKVDKEEEEQGGVDVLGTVVLKRESKLALKDMHRKLAGQIKQIVWRSGRAIWWSTRSIFSAFVRRIGQKSDGPR